MFDNPWYRSNSTSIHDTQGIKITSKIDSIIPSISDAQYMGLDSVVSQEGLQDYIADMKVNVSGSLDVALTCKASDNSGPLNEWKIGVTIPVGKMPVKIPLNEPSISIHGMAAIIWADRILNAGQFVAQWKKELLTYGHNLMDSPDVICANSPR